VDKVVDSSCEVDDSVKKIVPEVPSDGIEEVTGSLVGSEGRTVVLILLSVLLSFSSVKCVSSTGVEVCSKGRVVDVILLSLLISPVKFVSSTEVEVEGSKLRLVDASSTGLTVVDDSTLLVVVESIEVIVVITVEDWVENIEICESEVCNGNVVGVESVAEGTEIFSKTVVAVDESTKSSVDSIVDPIVVVACCASVSVVRTCDSVESVWENGSTVMVEEMVPTVVEGVESLV
jgi:hypothetical protein